MTFLDILKGRRSIYSIGDKEEVSKDKIEFLVQEAIKHIPTAYNSQSNRAVILFGKENQKHWQLVAEELGKVVEEDKREEALERLNMFKSGYGTVLFFIDDKDVNDLIEKMPNNRDNFKIWADQAQGMAQFAVWTLLSEIGLGASLQHYHNLVGDKTKEIYNLPESFRLTAQMPFGNILAGAGQKDLKNNTVKTFGK